MEYDDSGRLVSKRPCGGGGGGGGFPGASALETERSIVEHVLQVIGEKGNGGGVRHIRLARVHERGRLERTHAHVCNWDLCPSELFH